MGESADQLSQRTEVREALAQASGPARKVEAPAREKLWFTTFLLGLAGAVILHYLLGAGFLPLAETHVQLARRLTVGAAILILLFALGKAITVYGLGRVEDASTRFTLKRVTHFVLGLLVALVILSVLFVNWHAALISVGVLSVILGLAVQTPMTSLIGWIYILTRRPYRVGDRIRIDNATGDVIDVSYLDTTLWEFGGDFLSTDHPSGRIIKFPNSKVLDSVVFNYSWPLFPYIWDEIKFQVAYQSDLEFIAQTMQRIVEEELGAEMVQRVEVYRELLARTPVDELEVRAHPRVLFRVNEVTWLDAIVRFLAPTREAGAIKSRLIPKLLAALNAAPDKVMFPAGASR